jgi:hypothetical protein
MRAINHKDDAVRKVIHLAERKLRQKCLIAYVANYAKAETFTFGLCFKMGNLTFYISAQMLLDPPPGNEYYVNDRVCQLCNLLIEMKAAQ